MKKLQLVLVGLIIASAVQLNHELWFWAASPAQAQNLTCPTRPVGDVSNACASTAFVSVGALANFASPPPIGIGIPNIAVFTTIDTPQLPGLNTNVVSSGVPGLDFPCTGTVDCGWFIYQAPTTPAEDDISALRVQRAAAYTGGSGASINATLWSLVSTAPHGANSEWAIVGQLYNESQASFSGTGTGSVAVNATSQKINPAGVGGGLQPTTVTISNGSPAVITWTAHGLVTGDHFQLFTTGTLPASLAVKTWYYVIATGLTANTFEFSLTNNGAAVNTSTAGTGTQSAVYEVGSTWAFNSNCLFQKDIVNPMNSCAGAEIDINGFPGNGTDANLQRVGLQIEAGVEGGTDTGVHIGRLLLMGAQSGAVIDRAMELDDTNNTNHFIMTGQGNSTWGCGTGSWSASNFSPCVVLAGGYSTNPAFGIFDASNINGWAVEVSSGNLDFWTMPALSDSGSAPVAMAGIARLGGGGIIYPVYTFAQLSALSGMVKGQVVYTYDTVFTTPVWHGVVAGASNVTVGGLVSYNGTNWTWD